MLTEVGINKKGACCFTHPFELNNAWKDTQNDWIDSRVFTSSARVLLYQAPLCKFRAVFFSVH